VRRLGDDKFIPIDVRVIAASNQNLGRLVQEGHFRADLYYRINVLNLEIPRSGRGKKIFPCWQPILSRGIAATRSRPLSPPRHWSCCRCMTGRGTCGSWRNVLERLIVIADDHVITAANVEAALAGELQADQIKARPAAAAGTASDSDGAGAHAAFGEREREEISPQKSHGDEGLLSKMEKETILKVLEQVNGKRQEAARILGISSTTLWRRLKKLGIS